MVGTTQRVLHALSQKHFAMVLRTGNPCPRFIGEGTKTPKFKYLHPGFNARIQNSIHVVSNSFLDMTAGWKALGIWESMALSDR